jgi:hypothetical protein
MNPAVAAAKLAVKQTCPFLAQSKTSLASNQLPALVQTFSGICPFLKSVATDPNLPAAVTQKLAVATNGAPDVTHLNRHPSHFFLVFSLVHIVPLTHSLRFGVCFACMVGENA